MAGDEKVDEGEELRVDRGALLVSMLERALEDYALIHSGDKNYLNAKHWLFGEKKPLSPSDGRDSNYTLEQVCDVLGGEPQRVRKVALFMRRFRLNCKQLVRIYWDENNG